VSWGGFRVPHPLDVDIRQLPHDTHHLDAGGGLREFYVGSCPDGCGLVAWAEDMLPFNARRHAKPDQ